MARKRSDRRSVNVDGVAARRIETVGTDGTPRASAKRVSTFIFPLFRPDGCVLNIRSVHAAYLDGALSDDQCWEIDTHLLACRRCENTFDALSSELDDEIPTEVIDRCAAEREKYLEQGGAENNVGAFI